MRVNHLLQSHLLALSYAYSLLVSDDYSYAIVNNFKLPNGFNQRSCKVLIELPDDYPCSPPGVGGHRIYVPQSLLYQGRELKDFHSHSSPHPGDWAWLCFERIDWNATRDDLVRLLEMIRAYLTNPRTKGWW